MKTYRKAQSGTTESLTTGRLTEDAGEQRSETGGLTSGGHEGGGLRFLTRTELAGILQVSLRTVDAMVEAKEVPCVRLRGAIVRFYLPDVVERLTGTAEAKAEG